MKRIVVGTLTLLGMFSTCLADSLYDEDHRKGYVSISGNFGQIMNSVINNLSEEGAFTYPAGASLEDQDTSLNLHQVKVEFEDTFGLNVAVGHYIFAPFRVEIEGSYHRGNVDSVKSAFDYQQDASGPISDTRVFQIDDDIEMISVLANAYIDIPIYKKLSAYAGAGIGVTWYSLDTTMQVASFTVPHPPGDATGGSTTINQTLPLNDDSVVLAYQMMVGLSYRINEMIVLTGGYRLKGTDHPSFNDVEFDAPLIHLGEFGIRFEF